MSEAAAGRRIDLVFPRFKLMSGAERAILGLAEALARAGHSPRIVCHQFDESCRPRLADGVELVVSGARLDFFRNRYLNAMFDYARTLKLRPMLDPRADFRVFFGPALLLAWRTRRPNRRRGVPGIYYCWEPPRVLYQDRAEVLARLGWLRLPMSSALALYRWLDRRMVAAADAVITSSPFAAARIEDCYGRSADVITLGIDRQRLDAERCERGAGDVTLLTVNYLHPRKRVGLIVEALAKVRIDRKVTLMVVGDGPERQALEELAARLGVGDRVQFAGFVADEDLPRYYWGSACYVHATRDESFGLSVIEASYCGRPVVAVNEGGVNDTIDNGSTGYLVDATPLAIAEGIERVLAAVDGGAGLGEAGRTRIASRFRWSQGAEDVLGTARRVGDGWSGVR